jgi:hypothetical protein
MTLQVFFLPNLKETKEFFNLGQGQSKVSFSRGSPRHTIEFLNQNARKQVYK